MRSHSLVLVAGLLCSSLSAAGCETDPQAANDGGGEQGPADLAIVVSEDTAARCSDGQDNDGDGHVDCEDQDCWVFASCADSGVSADLPRPDVTALDLPAPDAAAPDLSAADALQVVDLSPPDIAPPDAALPDSSGLCKTHCDCPQGQFCYLTKCITDPDMPVYCCNKPGCPPGWWCMDPGGKKKTCQATTKHKCKDACDCGPAHCCINGLCVKDTKDPWRPGGATTGGLSCQEGKDPTYCCTAPECHHGRFAYKDNAATFFRCFSRAANRADSRCGGRSCFGTACNCKPGEVCVDTVRAATPGHTCMLLQGGSCVAPALAAAVYGFKASDLLQCCTKSCVKGTKCDAGWRRAGNKYAYQRVVGSCGSCGNGKCDEGESPSTCAADCSCGDGVCAPDEVGTCANDCLVSCGNAKCDPWETPKSCAADCAGCGDGWCAGAESAVSCPADCAGRCADAALYSDLYRICGDGVCADSGCQDPETCRSCPQDCGPCDDKWQLMRRAMPWQARYLLGVWGSGPSDVFAVGYSGTILRHDGTKWSVMASGTSERLMAVGGMGAKAVLAVGLKGTVLRYDGSAWQAVSAGTTRDLYAVWGSPSGVAFVAGDGGTMLRYSGGKWTPSPTGTSNLLGGVWGSSATDVFAVGYNGTILHFDGKAWSAMASGTTNHLLGVWGSSPTKVLAVGSKGTALRYDGKAWLPLKTPTVEQLAAVWGTSATDVYAVGADLITGSLAGALILHFDGTAWSRVNANAAGMLHGVWASSAGKIFAVGGQTTWFAYGAAGSLVLQHDGSSWRQMTRGRVFDYTSIWGASPSDVFIGGNFCHVGSFKPCSRQIVRFNGAKVSTIKEDSVGYTSPPAEGMWASSATDLYVVGSGNLGVFGAHKGRVDHWDGAKWSNLLSQSKLELNAVWGSGPSDLTVVGDSGSVLRYHGGKWSSSSLSTAQHLTAIWGAGPSDLFVGGDQGQVLRLQGNKWQSVGAGLAPMTALWGSSAADVYGVGQGGSISRYDGKAWSAVQAKGQDLRGIWGATPTDILAVGRASTMWRFDGKAWRRQRVDLREPSSAGYTCPDLNAVWGSAAGEYIVAGTQEAVLRRCPQGCACGDGVLNKPAEQCDGAQLGGQTCAGLGHLGGQLSCASDCSFNTAGCYGFALEPKGMIVSYHLHAQRFPAVAFGGQYFLVVWQDARNGTFDIYGARVTPGGGLLDPQGIPIAKASGNQTTPKVAFDGTNFLVVWHDQRKSPQPLIYGARVSVAGKVLDPAGIPISGANKSHYDPALACGAGGCLVAYSVNTGWASYDIRGRRVMASGKVLDPAGIGITTASGSHFSPEVAFNGSYYLVVWEDNRKGFSNSDIYGARVSPFGWLMDAKDIPISTAAKRQNAANVVRQGQGFLVSWQDARGSSIEPYWTRISSAGAVQDANGVTMLPATGGAASWPQLASGKQGSLLVWTDSRNAAAGKDIYGTRIGASGAALDAGGRKIYSGATNQYLPAVAFGKTSYLVVWGDERNGAWLTDIYGTRVRTK